ncbi:hypothetical protein H072_7075 [Dactylellina haptotyla CBS 200.50]|uniref:Uncharacterized protein n=1 Tax=Dactylellina haptotyla (strain CBS 200.50) TaxID=1284197 RepID=S8ADF0_DACHA|nr:hypothetical protein H072_7075 [Dactylellina haptotyla CBS 200.50]
MSSKTIVVITGANTGIGLEAVKAFLGASNPYHIFMGARSPEKLDAAIQSLGDTGKHTIVPFQLDLFSDDSINEAYAKISAQVDYIDVLINNAGAATNLPPSREVLMQDFNVNVAGTYAVTDIFLPLLIKSSAPRLLFLTSGLSSLEEAGQSTSPRYMIPPAGWPKSKDTPQFLCYRVSKAALNMVMIDFQRILKNDNVKVWCISPGMLATNLGGNPELLKKLGAEDPAVGGIFIKDVVEGARDGDTGKVIQRGKIQPW